MIEAAANVAKALKARGADVGITLLAGHANSMGLGLMGAIRWIRHWNNCRTAKPMRSWCWKTICIAMRQKRRSMRR